MPFVYILKCRDNTFYTGCARDLKARIRKHQSGRGAKYTRGRLPVRLMYSEACGSMGDALRRECEIKRLSRMQKTALIRSRQSGPSFTQRTSNE